MGRNELFLFSPHLISAARVEHAGCPGTLLAHRGFASARSACIQAAHGTGRAFALAAPAAPAAAVRT